MQNDNDHSFPVPASALETLEEVREELRRQPMQVRAADYIRANPFPVMIAAVFAGITLGFVLRNRG